MAQGAMSKTLIGILDVGKTHTKFIVADADSGRIAAQHERASRSIDGPVIRALDVVGIERWLRETLSAFPDKAAIEALVPVAHGAAAVLLDSEEQVHFAPDYEDHAFELVAETYRTQRDPFSETFSPFLPLGLNMGRQLFFLESRHATEFERIQSCLLYPQYWAWRLCGEKASEVTSLGCHSDLWRPREAKPSGLADRRGWSRMLPPLRAASDTLGRVSAELVHATGLDPGCRVHCGIHDSNASYLSHRIGRPAAEPFSVVSSGTWIIVMAHGSDLSRLRESHDMLANVDALGRAVPTARFMGGREYEAISGHGDAPVVPTRDALASILRRRAFALPPARAALKRPGFAGRLIRTEGLKGEERAALATAYLALRTDRRLSDLGATGDILVDGPLSTNRLYVELLANLRPECPIRLCDVRSGVLRASLVLAGIRPRAADYFHFALADRLHEFMAYKSEWTDLAYPHT
jgi:sugar (pentulose or hexulose) kinase